MSSEPSGVAFFLPPGGQHELAGMLGALAAERLGPGELSPWRWGVLECYPHVLELPGRQVLRATFSRRELFSYNSFAPEVNPVALAFRTACETLRPDVAYVASHPVDATVEAVRRAGPLVDSFDANGLADSWYSLLYLDDTVAAHWSPGPDRDNRDRMAVTSGVLVFAGRGEDRWF